MASSAGEPVIEVLDLAKVYRNNGVRALDGVSLSAKRGELLTLIGRNGAGKTTFVRILTTQLLPTSGSATVLGLDAVKEAKRVRHHIALVPQEAQTYMSMSPWDYVYYLTCLEGASTREAKERAVAALRDVGLGELARRPCFSLSGGEKRRAIVAAAIASKAEILFLDEPTIGLDPIIRRQIWSALRRLVDSGRTIILTTHLMEEAEIISDRLALIDKGRIVATGTPKEIRGSIAAKARVVISGGGVDSFAPSYDGDGGEAVTMGDRQIIYLRNPSVAPELVAQAYRSGLAAEVSPITLEDVFYRILGGPVDE